MYQIEIDLILIGGYINTIKKLDRINKNRNGSSIKGYFSSYDKMEIKDDDGNTLFKIERPFLRINYGAVEGKEQNPQDYVKFGLLLKFLEKKY